MFVSTGIPCKAWNVDFLGPNPEWTNHNLWMQDQNLQMQEFPGDSDVSKWFRSYPYGSCIHCNYLCV